jgi:hypothetical protein
MPKSPTGIIPAQYNTGAYVRHVIDHLKALPLPGEDKVELLFGWARNVGVKISGPQRAEVKASGDDQ